jgi:DNA-binding SARP family transcriptional activator
VRIALLGRIVVSGRNGRLDEDSLRGRRLRLALAYLVLHRGRPIARAELAEALWGEALPSAWEPALRTVVSGLRRFLETAGTGATLKSVTGCYVLDLPADAVVDVDTAQHELDRAGRALAVGDANEAVEAAKRARLIASMPFLPGEESAWIDTIRDRLRERVLVSLDMLAAAATAAGEHASAVRSAREAVALDPLREATHRRLMQAHVAAGNRAEALSAYEQCRRTLAAELGVSPSRATDAVYRELLDDDAFPAAPRAAEPPTSTRPVTQDLVEAAIGPHLIGRDAELTHLRVAWRQTASGHGRTIVITGEPGIGKTRLLAEVAKVCSADDGTVLYGRCDRGMLLPYQPFVEALDCDLSATPGDQLSALRALCARKPVLLCLDDLQWAMPETLALLRFLARPARELPLLIVAAAHSALGLRSHPSVKTVALEGLTRHELSAWSHDALEPAGLELTIDGLDGLVTATGGNPIFVAELLRRLAKSGSSALTAADVAAIAGDNVPTTVRDLVEGRVQELSRDGRELLMAASVMGSEFDMDVVAEVVDLKERAFLDALDEVQTAALVLPVEHVGGARHRFAHGLVRDVVYDHLSDARRRRLHRRAGAALNAPLDARPRSGRSPQDASVSPGD